MNKEEEAHEIINILTGEEPEVRFESGDRVDSEPNESSQPVTLNRSKMEKSSGLKGKIVNPFIGGPWSLSEHDEEWAEHVYREGSKHLQSLETERSEEELNEKEISALRFLYKGQVDSMWNEKPSIIEPHPEVAVYNRTIGKTSVAEEAARKLEDFSEDYQIIASEVGGRDDRAVSRGSEKSPENEQRPVSKIDFRDEEIDTEKLSSHLKETEKKLEEGFKRLSSSHYPDTRVNSPGETPSLTRREVFFRYIAPPRP